MTVYYNAHFGESSGPYHLSGLRCGGYEVNLLNCSRRYTTGGVYKNGIGVHGTVRWVGKATASRKFTVTVVGIETVSNTSFQMMIPNGYVV